MSLNRQASTAGTGETNPDPRDNVSGTPGHRTVQAPTRGTLSAATHVEPTQLGQEDRTVMADFKAQPEAGIGMAEVKTALGSRRGAGACIWRLAPQKKSRRTDHGSCRRTRIDSPVGQQTARNSRRHPFPPA